MLLRAHPFRFPNADTLANVQREMEDLFGRVLHDAPQKPVAHGWRASTAVWEDADKVYLELEIPGVSKDTLDLTVHNGILRITGERKSPEGDRNYRVNERVYGTFERKIALPDDIDTDNIDARSCDGVLTVVLSKRPEAQPKKVTLRD